MSAMGQKQTLKPIKLMSAVAGKADIFLEIANVRFVPKADIACAQIIYSILVLLAKFTRTKTCLSTERLCKIACILIAQVQRNLSNFLVRV